MKPVILVVPAALYVLGQTGVNAAAPPSLPFENMGQVWLATILLAQTVFTYFMASRREARARAWLIEDRKMADEHSEKQALKIREDLLREADVIKREAWNRADTLKDQIAENTRISSLRLGEDVPSPEKKRRPDDSPPSYDRRKDDKKSVPPTRRIEDEPEKEGEGP